MILNPFGRAKIIPAKPKALMLPYQAKWIRDASRLKLMEKSRQIGISWATAYRFSRETSKKGRMYDTWVSSRDDIQARLFLEDCKSFSNILQVAAEDLGKQVYEDENGKPYTSYDIRYANKCAIHSMSSNPDAQAGKRGTRGLDEFALHPDPRKLYSIAYPGITWGGQMEMISTHRGTLNFFNQLVLEVTQGENKKNISLHTVTLQDALDQGFLYKLQEKLRRATDDDERLEMDEAEYFNFIKDGCADEETFLQEYMCQPSDDATAFLPYEWIDRAKFQVGENWKTDLLDCVNPLYLGMDIGREHDLSVIWVLEKIGQFYFTRRCIELYKTPFHIQESILYELLRLPQMRRACIDASGIGIQLAEDAHRRFRSKVEGITFTPRVKEELAYALRPVFEDAAIRIPPDPKGTIAADLRAVKKETTASGSIRFTADRGKNGHADRFWALALGIHASTTARNPGKPRTGRGFKSNSRSAARRDRAVESRSWGGIR